VADKAVEFEKKKNRIPSRQQGSNNRKLKNQSAKIKMTNKNLKIDNCPYLL
jgi:hypothetical protein